MLAFGIAVVDYRIVIGDFCGRTIVCIIFKSDVINAFCSICFVSNISGAGKEFLLRGSDSTIKVVPEMRWLNAPEAMLKSAMLMKFAGNEQTPAVSAQIVRFEFTPDFRSLEAVIIFSVRSEKNIVCIESVPVKDKNYGKAAAELFCRVINKVTASVKK